MDITTSLAASRLIAQQRAMDVTANNIANASTPGYRTERVQFSDWIDQQTGTAAPPGGRTITYTQDRATWREQTPGTLTHTANTFDLALTGEGYFTVSTKAGPRLTRDGRFGPTPDGTLADSSGNPVLDIAGKPIQLSLADTQFAISGDGSITSEAGRSARSAWFSQPIQCGSGPRGQRTLPPTLRHSLSPRQALCRARSSSRAFSR